MKHLSSKEDLCRKSLTVVDSMSDGVFAVDMEMKYVSLAVVESQRTAITNTFLLQRNNHSKQPHHVLLCGVAVGNIRYGIF